MKEIDSPDIEPSWRQVSIQFEDWIAAEQIGAAQIGPVLFEAEAAELIASWFFIRKAPRWRLRYMPAGEGAVEEATALIRSRLNNLREVGLIERWVETIYEPEIHAFGGPLGMKTSHDLFHRDSREILNYLCSDRVRQSAGERVDQRRELSLLLCVILMRGAAQDWYEQGDIWARVGEHRSLSPDMPLDRLRRMEVKLRRLMTVDTKSLLMKGRPLAFISDWAAAFDSAGSELGRLASDGVLRRGLRDVLAHHVIFAWNRIGMSYTAQSTLANAAKAVVFGPDLAT